MHYNANRCYADQIVNMHAFCLLVILQRFYREKKLSINLLCVEVIQLKHTIDMLYLLFLTSFAKSYTGISKII